MADDKQLARQFVQELLTKIGQIDGEQRRDAVKHQIRDAGREYGRLKELVREQTALYAPELKERWEDILRRTEAARPGAVPANPAGLAGGTPPAHPAQHPTHPRQPAQATPTYGAAGQAAAANLQQTAHPAHPAKLAQPHHLPDPAARPAGAPGAQAPFPTAPGGNPVQHHNYHRPTPMSASASDCLACRGKHREHTCAKAKAGTPGAAAKSAVPVTMAAGGAGAPRPAAAPGGTPIPPVQAVPVAARGPSGMVPGGQGGMGVPGAGGDMSAGAKRQREEADADAQERRKRQMEVLAMPRQDEMDSHILRIFRTAAMQSQEKVQKDKQQGKKGDVALDPRRVPDHHVRAMIRKACELRLSQVVMALVEIAKVRTEKLGYEAAKKNRYQGKLTLQPMLLLNQAENDAQTGQQAGGALAASNQAALHALNVGSKAGVDAGPGKRKIELRDMLFFLERDPLLRKSPLTYRAFLRAHEDHSKKLTAMANKRNSDALTKSEELAQKLRANMSAPLAQRSAAPVARTQPVAHPPSVARPAAPGNGPGMPQQGGQHVSR